ncbi:DUF2878 family protein [Marinimicrobium sp. ARAG 43.8]
MHKHYAVVNAVAAQHALKPVYERPWLLAVMGAVAGPMAYWGGIRLSDAAWGMTMPQGFLIMMLIWCWLLPLHRWLTLEGGKRWFD